MDFTFILILVGIIALYIIYKRSALGSIGSLFGNITAPFKDIFGGFDGGLFGATGSPGASMLLNSG